MKKEMNQLFEEYINNGTLPESYRDRSALLCMARSHILSIKSKHQISDPVPGFLIDVWDGSKWIIPFSACVEKDRELHEPYHEEEEDGPYDIEKERIDSLARVKRMTHEADIEEFFSGTEWSEFSKSAIMISYPTDDNMDAMWEMAKISNTEV